MAAAKYLPGDWVIYRKTKFGNQPGIGARNVSPNRNGDGYTYSVDKQWVVVAALPDGSLDLITGRGKRHIVSSADLSLRRASWWERFRYRQRFLDASRLAEATLAGNGIRTA